MSTLLCFAVVLGAHVADSHPQDPDISGPPEVRQSTANIVAAKPAEDGGLLQQVIGKLLAVTEFIPKLNKVPSAAASQVTPIQDAATTSTGTAVWLRISRQRLADYIERSVNRTKPVRDTIVGTPIVGESHTTGNVRFVLFPSEGKALGEIIFEGQVNALTTGHNGPAVMDYNSQSTVRGHKRILIDESGLVAEPAVAEAPTQLRPTSIRTNLPGLRGRIGQRIAERRVNASLGQATTEVADHTARDVSHDLDEKIDGSIASTQSSLKSQLAQIKLHDKAQPIVIRSRSTKAFVEIALCDRDTKQMPTFEVVGNPDVAVRVHRGVLATIASNSDLSVRLAPVLGTMLVGDLIEDTGRTNRPVPDKTATKWTIDGDWIALDLATPNLDAARVALEARADEPTIK